MPAMPSERWAARSYRDLRDYSLMGSPRWLQEPVQSMLRASMLRRIAARRGGSPKYDWALDLGCGVGDWTLGYLSIAERVVGVDVNESFLEQARARRGREGRESVARFERSTLEAWSEFEGVGFVALGACLMYVDDAALGALLARVSSALPPDGMLYVRASVVTPLRAPFANGEGYYRDRSFYEARFARHGLSAVYSAPSAQVVVDGLLGPVPASRWLRAAVSGGARAERVLRRQLDYMNWLLVPAGAARV